MPRKSQPKKSQSNNFRDDELVSRIAECNSVLTHLDSCEAWKVIYKDLLEQKQILDDHWQDINEEHKLQKARELKFAYMHLINLREKYTNDLESAKRELRISQNQDNEIIRDYDTETTYE